MPFASIVLPLCRGSTWYLMAFELEVSEVRDSFSLSPDPLLVIPWLESSHREDNQLWGQEAVGSGVVGVVWWWTWCSLWFFPTLMMLWFYNSFSFAFLTENKGAQARRHSELSPMWSCSKILMLYLKWCLMLAGNSNPRSWTSLTGQEDLIGSPKQSKALKQNYFLSFPTILG